MKRFFTLLVLCFLWLFALCANAEELYKINNANFDTSNSIIVLSASDTQAGHIAENIKLVKLEGKAYFDIDDAVMTIPKQDWIFNSGALKEIKINQFSTEPCKVRIVLYYDNDFNPDKIKFYRVKNHIIIKLKNSGVCDNPYFQNTYRDEHSSSSDFYEYMTVQTPVPAVNDTIVGQINNAFNTQTKQILAKKDLKLNTRYYLNNISIKQNGILINGFGAATIERPMLLQNPSRIVYDLPNTLVDNKLRNKEFKINETEYVKIGQFSVNKARVVIYTEDTGDYIPIYSGDNQSLIIANYKKTNNTTLYNSASSISSFSKEKIDSLTESLIIKFTSPIVHGLDRYNDKLIIYLYNISKYDQENFQKVFENTFFENAIIETMPKMGLKLTIPLEMDAMINTYLGSDGRGLKIKIKQVNKNNMIL